MLTLGWSDGSTFIPVNSILISSETEKHCINEAVDLDKRTIGYKQRQLSVTKGTHAMLELLRAAKSVNIPAKAIFVSVKSVILCLMMQ